jgi:hypothetical protein
MNDFFSSKFMTDLEEGKLPPVVIEFDMLNILILCIALFVTGLLLIKVSKSI